MERYIVGDYVKYNSNAGFVQVGDEAGASGHLRATPQVSTSNILYIYIIHIYIL